MYEKLFSDCYIIFILLCEAFISYVNAIYHVMMHFNNHYVML